MKAVRCLTIPGMCVLVVDCLKSAETGVVGGQQPEPPTVEEEVPGLAHLKLIG